MKHYHPITHHTPSNKLHVISVISNPARYHSRYKLFRQFQQEMSENNVDFYCVELGFGPRQFEVTDSSNPRHIQVVGNSEVWHKENLINIGFSRLPFNWQYAAWIDGDISFVNKHWVEETLHALHHSPIVQLFQNCVDLGPNGESLQTHLGLAYQYTQGSEPDVGEYGGYGITGAHWHPGYAWAITREGFATTGPLLDFGIAGAGDHHMAKCWIGKGASSIPAGLHKNYADLVMSYQERCEKGIQHNIGYVPGTIVHHFHGKKKDRRYLERWQILLKNNYDPQVDIVKNFQGVYELAGNKPQLRDDLRTYFRQRNEDSIDLE